ncbi:hypothetical protein [Puniceibacterium sediminis]|uniref:Type IV pilus biogenesis protein PilP n=1 Tax=Puniceibacterium sediminis TaxID=1608407 RepID=A0A238XAI6_9RHOB|nr:hypothetical protein [Puniceibacterium sediminis]SNR55730.1 hypothetical protein SAMN06265370_11044 [Puniceibacterium sediminis]
MKINFALSLSFEGISLLGRVPGGWAVLGEVPLDSEDLSGELQSLREIADARGAHHGQVKLVIPNEQIRYLTLPKPETDGDAAVRRALDAATPYAVADLVYDTSGTGGTLMVAAVARETLDEAESFARGHFFEPVCFVARPPAGHFTGEVFFGPAPGWVGAVPTRDSGAMSIVALPDASDDVPATRPATKPESPAAKDEPPRAATMASTRAPKRLEPSVNDAPVAPQPVAAARANPALRSVAPAIPPKPALTEVEPLVAAASAAELQTLEKTAPDDAKEALAPGTADVATTTLKVPQPESGRPISPDLSPSRAPAAAQSAFVNLRATRDLPLPDGTAAPVIDQPRAELSEGIALRVTPRPTEEPAPPPSDPIPATPPKEAAASLVKGFFSRRDHTRHAPEMAAPPSDRMPDTAKTGTTPPKAGKITAFRHEPSATASTPAAAVSAKEAERLRMTVFGARQKEMQVGGKPRFLGVMLTLALLLILIGVAAWASVFLDEGLARFFRRDSTPQIETAQTSGPLTTSETSDPELQPEPDADGETELASLATDLPATVVDTAPEPLSTPTRARSLTQEEAETRYAASGIWQRTPAAPPEPSQTEIDDLYVASIDPEVQKFDAIALPAAQVLRGDTTYEAPIPPLPADVTFDLDERGFVRATIEGAINPDGILIFAGLPPVVPPRRDASSVLSQPAPTPESSAATAAEQDRLQAFRPKSRPGNLIERNERASRSGVSLAELEAFRPKLRPEAAKKLEEADVTATELAIEESIKPLPRPQDIQRIVEAARAAPPEQTAVQVATVAPRTVAPSIPSSTSVAQQATVRNAINLRQLNLIGVYGAPSSRRALVRMSNGRYQKVKVGDTIDGGRVAAIGENELHYTKSGRNIVLKMPQG